VLLIYEEKSVTNCIYKLKNISTTW